MALNSPNFDQLAMALIVKTNTSMLAPINQQTANCDFNNEIKHRSS